MTRIREAILVEGRYDVNTVRQVVDTVVLESGGFRIFNNKDQLKLLRRIAETRGLIVLTDSDGAGFVIRNYLKGALPKGCVKQAYVPDIAGKERRKRHGSKEGKLGVESNGMMCGLYELGLDERDFPYAAIVPAAILNDYHTLDKDKPSIPADIHSGGNDNCSICSLVIG